MPRSFLVKSQEYRDKEKKRGLGIAKLVYDPTRAVTVVTTLAKPEPRRPIINYVQSSINPTRWYQSWISTPAISTSCEVTTPPLTPALRPRCWIFAEAVYFSSILPSVLTLTGVVSFSALRLRSFDGGPHLQIILLFSSSDEESRLSSLDLLWRNLSRKESI
ncbi:hypothetical protein BSL78_17445 [Apostichopus japonicus]|uniref:Uncharacterized protein n=1 Tax=Stichopus japonicus TaxID=307972 RepID=A0A2G8KCG6_STIJA|nr:hypothetical protein BSL78_17445 [Apostichopus japonicus]